MKKSDLAMIVLIASTSVLIAYFSAKAIFGDVYNGTATVQTIDLISSDISEPSPEIFNDDAINPTIRVEVDGTE